MYRRSVNLNNILKTEVVSEVENNKLEELKKQIDNIKLDKNLNIFKKFMDEKTIYNFDKYTPTSELRDKYKRYAYDLNKDNLDNLFFSFKEKDILDYNPKLKIKSYSFCRSCKNRYRYGCCDENNRLNRSTKQVVLYLELL